jgi:ABC-type dipeptide/oligopeptide/nickel transport system permease component
MPGRIPFTLNTMVMLPLLRSLPLSGAASVAATLISMTGLDFGILGLGHPETAADDFVAWMMSFSVLVPACWAAYMALAFWQWATGFIGHLRSPRS